MNELSRAYRQASVQVRALAEKNNVALTGRDVDKVVRAYGLRSDPSMIDGDSVALAHRSLERMSHEAESGELLLRCQKQAEISAVRTSATHVTSDDVERLQKFARMHSRTELSKTQAEAILRSHTDLLQQPSTNIGRAITDFKTTNNVKFIAGKSARGMLAVTKVISVASSAAQASNDDNSAGMDPRGAIGEGYELSKEGRRELVYRSRLEKEYRSGDKIIKNPKSTGRNARIKSPRQNKVAGTTGRNASKTTKTRAAFAKTKVKWEKPVKSIAERSASLRRGAAVSNMVGKKKAEEAIAEGTKETAKSALAKWTEGKNAAGAGKFLLALLLACCLVALIFACITAVIVVLTQTYASRNALIGDWYDSNTYKTKNFVEITQDLQRKYYDDCLALAYEVGADTPKPEDVRIDWKEVYSLWSVIVRYRSGNEKMQTLYKNGDIDVTGYSSSSPVFNLGSGDENRPMFSSGDDYLQDFYLAFYSMYYDLKAVDYRGNPIVYDRTNSEWYYPYYPEMEGGTGEAYGYFSALNKYPLKGQTSGTVIDDILYKDEYEWKINTHGRYYFVYCTDKGSGTDADGCFNRGKPKVTITNDLVTETFEYEREQVPTYFKIYWEGYSLDIKQYELNFHGSDSCNGFHIDSVHQESHEGDRTVYGSDRDAIRDKNATNVIFNDYVVSVRVNPCSLCSSGSQKHRHWFTYRNGTYEDLFYVREPDVFEYHDAKLVYPNPTALDGLEALHDVYNRVYNVDYGYSGGYGKPYTNGMTFFLGGSHLANDTCVIEKGTLYYNNNGKNKSDVHEKILVVLDQIFDRSAYYPWASWGFYPRWADGAPEDLFAYGLPGAVNGGGSKDCYESIKSSLNYIRSSSSGSYSGILPADNYLIATWDTGSNSHVNTYAVNNRDASKTSYNSVMEMIGKSITDVQYCFPFCVQYKPCTGVGESNAGSSWEKDALYGSVDGAWDCLSFRWYDMHPHWTSTTYLLYRYFMAEQNMCPAAVCGILGALELETTFSASGYKSLTKDNNGCYALGLLQWNEGETVSGRPYGDGTVKWNGDEGHTNLYNNTLCSWCWQNDMNWRNAGAQLRFISECCSNGGPAGDYRDGVYYCQMLPLTYAGSFGSEIKFSAYTNEWGNPTFSAADSAGAYESCFWWGVQVERGVEQIGGTCNDSWHRVGYGGDGGSKDPSLLFSIEKGRAHNDSGQFAYEYMSEANPYWTGMNIDKQRMVAAHIFLRYISASDPNYYSVAYYSEDV